MHAASACEHPIGRSYQWVLLEVVRDEFNVEPRLAFQL